MSGKEKGFVIDTYFLALAKSRGYRLIIQDRPLCDHALNSGVDCLMIDESLGEDEIKAFMGG